MLFRSYQQALNLWNGSPQYLYGAGSFELQVLNYGIRKSAVSEELAVKAARLAAAGKREQELALRLLKQLYSQYPRTEILEAICSLMIRGDCRTKEDFVWYEKALGEQLSLTKLYEYFLPFRRVKNPSRSSVSIPTLVTPVPPLRT